MVKVNPKKIGDFVEYLKPKDYDNMIEWAEREIREYQKLIDTIKNKKMLK
jgi:hypothetical protein